MSVLITLEDGGTRPPTEAEAAVIRTSLSAAGTNVLEKDELTHLSALSSYPDGVSYMIVDSTLLDNWSAGLIGNTANGRVATFRNGTTGWQTIQEDQTAVRRDWSADGAVWGAAYVPESEAGSQAKVDTLKQAVITVADAAARKLAGTYAAGELMTGVTKVVQSDLPFVVWFYLNGDVTLDSSWFGVPYTTSPDGDIIVSMELADVTGTVPDLNVLGVSGGVLSIGNGLAAGGRRVAMETPIPAGMMKVTSGKMTLDQFGNGPGTIAVSTSGHTAFRLWDGSIQIKPSSGTIYAPVPAWDIYMWGATGAADSTPSGDLTRVSVVSNVNETYDLLGMEASSLPELYEFHASYNPNLRFLDLTMCPKISSVIASNSPQLNRILLPTDSTTAFQTGTYIQIEISDCGFSATDLNELFLSLPASALVGATLYVAGNPGAATCDPSLAPANWTVYTT